MLTDAATGPVAAGRSSDGVARYNLFNAWPVKPVNGGGDVLQQEWTLTFESIQR